MISRQMEYNPYSNQRPSINYGDSRGYGSDSISFPSINPYSFSSPQINPYSYQYQPEPKYQQVPNQQTENLRKIKNSQTL